LEQILRPLQQTPDVPMQSIVHVIDVLLVSYLLYRVLALVRGTRAWRIVFGVVIFFLLLFLSNYLQLRALHWVLDSARVLLPVAVVILLLPELRQALEGFSKIGLWPQLLVATESRTEARTVEEIVAAVTEMAASSVGALIVVERGPQLDEIVSNGVRLDAKVSAPLLGSIFYEGNPLHDGAVVIRGDTIVAGACRLPLSESVRLDANMHMRHRAGLGVTETYDCMCIIVSEERGTISVARDGKLRRMATHLELRDVLNKELRDVTQDKPDDKPRRRKLKKDVEEQTDTRVAN
jgi:diadenylate cyclase